MDRDLSLGNKGQFGNIDLNKIMGGIKKSDVKDPAQIKLFEHLDADNNNVLTKEELQAFFKEIGKEIEDGNLSKSEAKKYAKSLGLKSNDYEQIFRFLGRVAELSRGVTSVEADYEWYEGPTTVNITYEQRADGSVVTDYYNQADGSLYGRKTVLGESTVEEFYFDDGVTPQTIYEQDGETSHSAQYELKAQQEGEEPAAVIVSETYIEDGVETRDTYNDNGQITQREVTVNGRTTTTTYSNFDDEGNCDITIITPDETVHEIKSAQLTIDEYENGRRDISADYDEVTITHKDGSKIIKTATEIKEVAPDGSYTITNRETGEAIAYTSDGREIKPPPKVLAESFANGNRVNARIEAAETHLGNYNGSLMLPRKQTATKDKYPTTLFITLKGGGQMKLTLIDEENGIYESSARDRNFKIEVDLDGNITVRAANVEELRPILEYNLEQYRIAAANRARTREELTEGVPERYIKKLEDLGFPPVESNRALYRYFKENSTWNDYIIERIKSYKRSGETDPETIKKKIYTDSANWRSQNIRPGTYMDTAQYPVFNIYGSGVTIGGGYQLEYRYANGVNIPVNGVDVKGQPSIRQLCLEDFITQLGLDPATGEGKKIFDYILDTLSKEELASLNVDELIGLLRYGYYNDNGFSQNSYEHDTPKTVTLKSFQKFIWEKVPRTKPERVKNAEREEMERHNREVNRPMDDDDVEYLIQCRAKGERPPGYLEEKEEHFRKQAVDQFYHVLQDIYNYAAGYQDEIKSIGHLGAMAEQGFRLIFTWENSSTKLAELRDLVYDFQDLRNSIGQYSMTSNGRHDIFAEKFKKLFGVDYDLNAINNFKKTIVDIANENDKINRQIEAECQPIYDEFESGSISEYAATQRINTIREKYKTQLEAQNNRLAAEIRKVFGNQLLDRINSLSEDFKGYSGHIWVSDLLVDCILMVATMGGSELFTGGRMAVQGGKMLTGVVGREATGLAAREATGIVAREATGAVAREATEQVVQNGIRRVGRQALTHAREGAVGFVKFTTVKEGANWAFYGTASLLDNSNSFHVSWEDAGNSVKSIVFSAPMGAFMGLWGRFLTSPAVNKTVGKVGLKAVSNMFSGTSSAKGSEVLLKYFNGAFQKVTEIGVGGVLEAIGFTNYTVIESTITGLIDPQTGNFFDHVTEDGLLTTLKDMFVESGMNLAEMKGVCALLMRVFGKGANTGALHRQMASKCEKLNIERTGNGRYRISENNKLLKEATNSQELIDFLMRYEPTEAPVSRTPVLDQASKGQPSAEAPAETAKPGKVGVGSEKSQTIEEEVNNALPLISNGVDIAEMRRQVSSIKNRELRRELEKKIDARAEELRTESPAEFEAYTARLHELNDADVNAIFERHSALNKTDVRIIKAKIEYETNVDALRTLKDKLNTKEHTKGQGGVTADYKELYDAIDAKISKLENGTASQHVTEAPVAEVKAEEAHTTEVKAEAEEVAVDEVAVEGEEVHATEVKAEEAHTTGVKAEAEEVVVEVADEGIHAEEVMPAESNEIPVIKVKLPGQSEEIILDLAENEAPATGTAGASEAEIKIAQEVEAQINKVKALHDQMHTQDLGNKGSDPATSIGSDINNLFGIAKSHFKSAKTSAAAFFNQKVIGAAIKKGNAKGLTNEQYEIACNQMIEGLTEGSSAADIAKVKKFIESYDNIPEGIRTKFNTRIEECGYVFDAESGSFVQHKAHLSSQIDGLDVSNFKTKGPELEDAINNSNLSGFDKQILLKKLNKKFYELEAQAEAQSSSTVTNSAPEAKKPKPSLITYNNASAIEEAGINQYGKEGMPLKYSLSDMTADLLEYIGKLPLDEQIVLRENLNLRFIQEGGKYVLQDIPNLSFKATTKAEQDVLNILNKYTRENEIDIWPKSLKDEIEAFVKDVPEFMFMIGKPQNGTHMGSLDVHTLSVMEKALKYADEAGLTNEQREILKMTIMLHDMGKVFEGSGTSNTGHAALSKQYAKQILNRFDYSAEVKNRILNLIENHHWFKEYNNGNMTGEDVIAMFGHDLEIAKVFARADLESVNHDFHIHAMHVNSNVEYIVKIQHKLNSITGGTVHAEPAELPLYGDIKVENSNLEYIEYKLDPSKFEKIKIGDVEIDFNDPQLQHLMNNLADGESFAIGCTNPTTQYGDVKYKIGLHENGVSSHHLVITRKGSGFTITAHKPASVINNNIQTRPSADPAVANKIAQIKAHGTTSVNVSLNIDGHQIPFEVLKGYTQGSNGGYYAINKVTGDLYFIKEGVSTTSEIATAKVYEAAGIAVPEISYFTSADGKTAGMISKFIPDLTPVTGPCAAANEAYGMNVLLANWDAVISDNTCLTKSGKAVLIDCGGSLDHHAHQASTKPFKSIPTEILTFIDGIHNPGAKQVYSTMTREDLIKSLHKAVDLDPQTIKKIFSDMGMGNSYANTIIERQNFLRELLKKIESTPMDGKSMHQYLEGTMCSTLSEYIEKARSLGEIEDIEQALGFISGPEKAKLTEQLKAKKTYITEHPTLVKTYTDEEIVNLLKLSDNGYGQYTYNMSLVLKASIRSRYGDSQAQKAIQKISEPLSRKDIENIQTMLNNASKYMNINDLEPHQIILLYQNIKNTAIFDNPDAVPEAKWGSVMNVARAKLITGTTLQSFVDYKGSFSGEINWACSVIRVTQELIDARTTGKPITEDLITRIDNILTNGSGYISSNEIKNTLTGIRNGSSVPISEIKKMPSYLDKSVMRCIGRMQKYISTQVIPEDITLYRVEGFLYGSNPYGCLSTVRLRSGKMLSEALEEAVAGGESAIHEIEAQINGGYIDESTGVFRNYTALNDRFTSTRLITPNGVGGSGKVIWNFTVKKGSKGVFLEGNNLSGSLNNECEFLLQSNSQFTITHIEYDMDIGRWRVNAEVTN